MLNLVRYVVGTARACSSMKDHNLNLLKRYAGHSKWANIKHTKAAKDAQKSLLFNKMQRLIRLAIQEGGSADPNFNARLASVIEQAKKYSMPATNIKNAIEQCKDSKANAKPIHFEIRGPGGCVVITYVMTDNVQKMKTHINTIMRKCNCTLTSGAVPGLFEHKGVILTEITSQTSLDTAVEHALEVDAEDVTEEETEDGKFLQFTCDPNLLNQVKGKLEKLGYSVMSCDSEFLPKSRVTLSEADLEVVNKLYDKLNDEPDIVKLYDNIA